MASVSLQVRRLDGTCNEIHASSEATVSELLQQLVPRAALALSQLVAGTEVLDRECTLQDAGLLDGAELQLLQAKDIVECTSLADSGRTRESLVAVKIPTTATAIAAEAFVDCRSLCEVQIPESVTSIGDRAFAGCAMLSDMAIPDSVSIIGMSAFEGCRSLTEVHIPNSVEFIAYRAFASCQTLKKVNVSEKWAIPIPHCVFDGCKALREAPFNLLVDSGW
mmetsp:Transcript_57911/g.135634  ORF Transcript_57911/g.135634 Transcript_57911/m.135634 type:complete len:222 (-) Transcript_57911:36-701(-)